MMDVCTKNLERFVDFEKCQSLIKELNAKLTDDASDSPRTRSEFERLDEAFKRTIDRYQEQPELLEPYLADLIQDLTSSLSVLRQSSIRYHLIFKFLYQLIKVSGFKSIVKKFPHETDKLPLLVDLLSREDPQDKINWQTRFVLTVWLSIVVLTPFDLAKFDLQTVGQSMSEKIYSTLIRSLESHDSCQHVTAFCLAKFFSRSDILEKNLFPSQFIVDSVNEIKNVKTVVASSTDDVKLIGYLRTLAYMFKYLPREEMKKRSHSILDAILRLDIDKINRELINHLIIKVTQRVGLVLLSKRSAVWRYKRGARILGGHLSQEPIAKEISNMGGSSMPAKEHVAEDESIIVDNEDESSNAVALESILSILLVAAQNTQTKIRWSAAKGIARLSSRLSRERASDVIDMVMNNFFEPNSSEYAWHGGSLALAEMSRHGLILEEKLEKVTKAMGDAIIYDKIKGSFAVGSHVREAACYVFWAMARTYEDHLLAPYISSISINLLCTMLFDRELQCRRAASATFQELVGRQGTFSEEGINILTNVDYQSVGIRQFCYLDLATQVSKYGKKYYEPFIEHLIEKKIGHWDIQIRRLASDSLCALMLYPDHDFIRTNVVPQLCQFAEQNNDNNLKHGSILALAKVIKSLVPLDYQYFDEKLVEFVGNLAKICEKQLKSKQQAPNFIEAIANIIQSAERANFDYSDKSNILQQWESLALVALDSDNVNLRDIGAEALLTLYRYFYKNNKTSQDRLLTLMNRSLASANESSRCGGLRALSKLGLAISSGNFNLNAGQRAAATGLGGEICLDADTPDIILMSLASYIAKTTKESRGPGNADEVIFAEAKAEACEAFVNFIKSLNKNRLVLVSQWLRIGFDALLDKTEDYTFDRRGDIGVVVRRAAIRSLQDLTLFLLSVGYNNSLLFDSEEGNRVGRLIAKVLQQAVSYNNSAREQAALAFYRLISSDLPDNLIPHKIEILKLFEAYQVDDEFNWRDDSIFIFVRLLSKPEFSSDLWIGLMPAVGQVSDLCAKQFRDALSDYIISLADKPLEREQIFVSLLETLERTDLALQRLLTSGLITADYLLTQGLMNETSLEFQRRLADLCWKSRIANDPRRLMSVGRVLCAMLQFTGQVQLDCLKYCLTLLLNGYGKVRVYTAEQLYLSIMTYQSDLEDNLSSLVVGAQKQQPMATIDEKEVGLNNGGLQQQQQQQQQLHQQSASSTTGSLVSAISQYSGSDASNDGSKLDLERAMDLLSQTNWSEPLDKVKPVRDQICSCLLVSV